MVKFIQEVIINIVIFLLIGQSKEQYQYLMYLILALNICLTHIRYKQSEENLKNEGI